VTGWVERAVALNRCRSASSNRNGRILNSIWQSASLGYAQRESETTQNRRFGEPHTDIVRNCRSVGNIGNAGRRATLP